MLERLPVGAIQVHSGRLFINSVAEKIIGYSNAEIPTLNSWFRTLYGEVARDFLRKYRAQRREGFPGPKRGRIRRSDGVTRLLEFRACSDLAGEVWIVDDISDRVAANAELVAAKRVAEVASQAKSEFLANMSHEIRTPLNGILTMTQVMAQGELSEEQRDLLLIVRQSGRDLLHLLKDILDFSKMEAGKLDLEEAEFDPQEVLESTLAGFAVLAKKKDLQLWLDMAPSAKGLRRGDPARLRQIVANFVSNAVKFSEKGGVRIRAEGLGDNGHEGLQLAVTDTGLGIAAEKMDLLFRKFSQVDASTTRRFGGTGLGLAICQELGSLMGGKVWAESVEGEGSTFYASLMLPHVSETAAGVGAHGEIENFGEAPRVLRLLAAEDNPTNKIVLSTVMKVFGFELVLVDDGAQAVEAWRRSTFDAILMDVQMPVMDGVQATRAIRAAEAASGRVRTPIIALSANAFHHQISEYLSAGMDAHVAKPIELSALQSALDYILAPAETGRNVAADPRPVPGQSSTGQGST